MRIEKLDSSTKKNLLEDLLKRSPNSYGKYEASVKEILENVQKRRDEAVFAYTKQFDGAETDASNIQVTEDEIKEAYSLVDDSLIAVIRKAKKNIKEYHEKQRQYSWFDSRPDGTILGQKVTAPCPGRCLCARRESCISVFRADEYYAGKSSRSR